MSPATQQMPEELSPRRVGRRLIEIAVVVGAVALAVWLGPGLGTLRDRLGDASGGWLAAGVALELLSALCYVVIFRTVFCRRMSWRLSYQIGMAEQGANSVLSVSGAGGLALGAWALRRGGMPADHIARRTVAFFFLTSLANVAGVILFAALYLTGALPDDRNPALTLAFGGAALGATLLVLALPSLLGRGADEQAGGNGSGKLATGLQFVRHSVAQGVRDGVLLLRQRSPGVLGGSIGVLAFDIAVLGVCFRAFGHLPPFGVLVLGYLIGQLGGNVPLPGGIGGLEGGLIGAFALYHQPLATTAAAVLVYHAIALWVPALLGSAAFLALHRTLRREEQPMSICAPLADPLEVPVAAGSARAPA